MRTLLLGRKMKATDAKTIQEIGIPSMVLMERAAMAVAAEAEKAAKKDELLKDALPFQGIYPKERICINFL